MDLGELVCLPNGAPLCDCCPLQNLCQAHERKQELAYPAIERKKERPTDRLTVFLVESEGCVAIRKRPDSGLLSSLYELPNIKSNLSSAEVENLFPEATKLAKFKTHKHIFTHRVWDMVCYKVIFDKKPNLPDVIWVTKKDLEDRYALPTAFKVFCD